MQGCSPLCTLVAEGGDQLDLADPSPPIRALYLCKPWFGGQCQPLDDTQSPLKGVVYTIFLWSRQPRGFFEALKTFETPALQNAVWLSAQNGTCGSVQEDAGPQVLFPDGLPLVVVVAFSLLLSRLPRADSLTSPGAHGALSARHRHR